MLYILPTVCHVWMSALDLVQDEAKGLDIGQTYRNDSGRWLSLMFRVQLEDDIINKVLIATTDCTRFSSSYYYYYYYMLFHHG